MFNMNRCWITLLAVMVFSTAACSKTSGDAEKESLAPGEANKWSDPNYDVITAGSFNYTDYDIYGVYLLPPDKNSLDDAASADGASATPRNATRWTGGGGQRPSLAWDLRWTTPRKFKVWWERVVDKRALEASSPDYDEYTHRETRPGMAWCEGEITITRSPVKGKSGGIVLHFFPDGHVEGDMNFQVDGPDPKVAISMRDEQRKLTGRACLKEIPNPFYGRKKPAQWN
ncbi:DUF3304 domain-containing protein [Burkholderia cepacia]|uniref:DUF3304 domain-containing protein n=1 Tax=Burkholderia cepacia TaxID=292 RepID=UPI001CF3B380|nr:DUF3304 domain-containing protein [Burkholderia cepacia]MCA8281619.1 DUF3304 domain-containing protein [Burkholderia cepacia]